MSKKQIRPKFTKESVMANSIMTRIKSEKVTMRPKIFFIIGSIFAGLGLLTSIITGIFFTTLLRFALRTHGPMGEYRFQEIVASFPWWVLLLAVASIGMSILLLRRFEFSYKRNFGLIILLFVAAIILASFIIDASGLDTIWFRQGPMRRMIQQPHQQLYNRLAMPTSSAQKAFWW